MGTHLLTAPNSESIEQVADTYLDIVPRSERVANFIGTVAQEGADVYKNSEFAQEFIERQRYQYKQGIERGVSEGWLHEGASKAIDSVDSVKVVVGKKNDSLFGKHEEGVYIEDINTVLIRRAGLTDSLKNAHAIMSQTFRHEFNHAVLGRLPIFNEAVTEHIALTMKFGHPELVYPYSRPDLRGGYIDERRLLHIVLNEGSIQIPTHLVTRAYSDPDGFHGDAFKEFSKQVGEAWGEKRTLYKLSKLLDYYEDKLSQESGLTELEVQKLAVRQVIGKLRAWQKAKAEV